jgi:hypothetical protein
MRPCAGVNSASGRVDRRSSGSAGWITGSSGFVIGAAAGRRRNTRLDPGSFVVVMLKAMMGPDLVTLWPANYLQGLRPPSYGWAARRPRHSQRYSPRRGAAQRCIPRMPTRCVRSPAGSVPSRARRRRAAPAHCAVAARGARTHLEWRRPVNRWRPAIRNFAQRPARFRLKVPEWRRCRGPRARRGHRVSAASGS